MEEHINVSGFVVTTNQLVLNNYNIFINDEFVSPAQFIDAISVLDSAQEGDSVTLHLTSNGGSLDAVDGFLAAMQECEAPIHVKASGTVASAATMILLAADSVQITPFTEILLHSASFGSAGKSQDVLEAVTFRHKQCERLVREYYKHFLTDAELSDMIVNKREMLMDADEFIKRYEKRNKALAQEHEQEYDAVCEQDEADY